MTSPDHRHIPIPLDRITGITADRERPSRDPAVVSAASAMGVLRAPSPGH
jgi:hypothetical protein